MQRVAGGRARGRRSPQPCLTTPAASAALQGARGSVAFGAGRFAEALTAFDLALAAPGLAVDGRVEILERRARALDALDRPEEAIAAAAQGIEAIERLRASLVPRDYFKRGFDRSWSRLFALSVRRLADQGEATRALDVAEHARARAFADLVASRLAQRAPRLAAQAATPAPSPLVVRGPADTARRRGATLESAVDVRSATVEEMTGDRAGPGHDDHFVLGGRRSHAGLGHHADRRHPHAAPVDDPG